MVLVIGEGSAKTVQELAETELSQLRFELFTLGHVEEKGEIFE
jgi:hypothetical protein